MQFCYMGNCKERIYVRCNFTYSFNFIINWRASTMAL